MKYARIVLVGGGMILGLATWAAGFDGASVAQADRSMDHCIRKVQTEWGACGNEDGVEVKLANVCNEAVRVHWCVRGKSGRLHCGVHPALQPRRTSEARACASPRPPEILYEACHPDDRCRVSE